MEASAKSIQEPTTLHIIVIEGIKQLLAIQVEDMDRYGLEN